jgi:ubiquinone biosynthesis protein UbiJ
MINTTPLTQYAQLLKAAELTQQKEVKIPMQQARLLNATLIELLDKVNQDYESMFNSLKGNTEAAVVSVSMDGGGFSDN